jgi:hypothetical protein|tara:strand:- start:322 stop:774 length:453 start_codon:yes stop_codon:yes gene_type:complete
MDYIQVPLGGVSGYGKFAKVSKEDYSLIMRSSWHFREGYAVSKIGGKAVRMHRYVLNVTDPDQLVDHINRDRLDNRRENLRVYTPKQNANNRETSRKVFAFGEWNTIGDWATDPRCGCTYNVLRKRFDKGIMPEAAIVAPPDNYLGELYE